MDFFGDYHIPPLQFKNLAGTVRTAPPPAMLISGFQLYAIARGLFPRVLRLILDRETPIPETDARYRYGSFTFVTVIQEKPSAEEARAEVQHQLVKEKERIVREIALVDDARRSLLDRLAAIERELGTVDGGTSVSAGGRRRLHIASRSRKDDMA
jgi:hypothetical protein